MTRAVVCVTLVVAFAGVCSAGQRGGTGSPTLAGAIDIHVHSAPDSVERSIDSIDVAKLALARGMRAIVLKSHYEPTATMAFIVRKAGGLTSLSPRTVCIRSLPFLRTKALLAGDQFSQTTD